MQPVPDVLRLTLLALALAALAAPIAAQEAPNALSPHPRTDTGWQDRHRQYVDRAKQGGVDLLFFGDSITDGWRSAPKVWDRYYGPRKPANFGIGGDQTGHVLWRIENGEVEGIHPKVVVLMIGTNNLGGDKDEEIAGGIKAIVKDLREKLPEAKILLLGIFPRGEKPDHSRERIKGINERISKLDDGKSIKYLDIGSAFLEPDGTISREIMPDFLHLSTRGYGLWADAMEPTLGSLLEGK